MANPPIIIGPFDNVPAPGSPIKSDWPQEISTYVNALPKGVVGWARNATRTNGISAITDVPGMSVTWTALANRIYLVWWQLFLVKQTSEADVEIRLTNAANTNIDGSYHAVPLGKPGSFAGLTVETTIAAGANTRKLRVATGAGTVDVGSTAGIDSKLIVADLGPGAGLPT